VGLDCLSIVVHCWSEAVIDLDPEGMKLMNQRMARAALLSALVSFALCTGPGVASAKSEIKGAAILDHACGETTAKQMGLVQAGKMEEADGLATSEMQNQWKTMPADDRSMMSGMMKALSQTEDQCSNDIKANAVLEVDGPSVSLTVKKTTKDANGTSTSMTTQNFRFSGSECLISR
jgi:hypothetical protein